MTLSKKPVAKKRGRPLGSKNKTSAAKVRAWEKKTILEENNAVWDELRVKRCLHKLPISSIKRLATGR
jgi:hypothetical protein